METVMLSDAGRDALGYIGGCILALSLVPQVIKLLLTRSAADISLLWSIMYLLGTTLSLVYLLLIGALAGAIPVIFELAGCLITLALKLAYDHTAWGRQQQLQQAAALQEQLCEVLYAIEEQETGQQQQHGQLECRLPMKQPLAGDKQGNDSSLHSNYSHVDSMAQQQQQQHDTYHLSANGSIYREQAGFSSFGGATSVNIQSTQATAVNSTQTAVQPVALSDLKVMFQNPLAGGNSSAGTYATNSAASSADGATGPKPAAVAVAAAFAAALGKQSSLAGRHSAALHSPSLGGNAPSAVAALALALLQLQQQHHKQQPWYMRTGIRHGASIPTSSAGGIVLPSAASVVFGSNAPQQQQQPCCQCCHVCGAQQLSQQHQTAHSSIAGRLSLFGQGLAAYLSSGNSISARAGAGHAPAGRLTNQGVRDATASGLTQIAELGKRRSLDMAQGLSNWQLEQQPERSSVSLSSLGAESWKALRQRSIMLLSSTGNSSKASKLPASNAQQEQRQQYELRIPAATAEPRSIASAGASPTAAAQQSAVSSGSAAGCSPRQRMQVVAKSSRHIRLPPELPVIQSEPCTPRAAEIPAGAALSTPADQRKPTDAGSCIGTGAAAAEQKDGCAA